MTDDDSTPVDMPSVAHRKVADVEPELPKWCKGVLYDSKRNVVALRVVVPMPAQLGAALAALPVEFVMSPATARVLIKSLERCADASLALVLEVE